jgi:hypothetical protein
LLRNLAFDPLRALLIGNGLFFRRHLASFLLCRFSCPPALRGLRAAIPTESSKMLP